MTRLRAPWLDAPATQGVLALLGAAGFEAFAVGGCVRNALMGRPADDVDISTDARPDRVMALAKTAGLKALPTGIDHGTVTVIAQGTPFEITTYRRDVETDGRRAVVAFADTMAEDAARRDFTLNALYADATGAVHDPLGGLPDLDARRIRFIGVADDRIREDYLRILRFFRFFAWYGDPAEGADPDALDAIARLHDGLAQVSAERITTELLKLLRAPDPAPAVALMAQTGVLASVLPGASARASAPLVHLEGDAAADPLRRLAVLGGQTDALKLSNKERRTLDEIRTGIESAKAPAALGHLYGADLALSQVLARAALLEQPLAHDVAAEIARGAQAVFPVRAADLMPGLEGPALGVALDRLKADWIASNFSLERAALLARL